MTESLELARDVVGRIGRASGFLSDHEWKSEMPLACEVANATLLSGAQALVREAAGRPMVTSKSCDGTPITVTHRATHVQPNGKKVKVSGRKGQEFLVCNQFVRTQMGGASGMQTKVLLAEPTALVHGKTVPAILAACRQHWRRLRDLGHTGCAIEHYCWDRLPIQALEKQTRQWHAAQPMPPLPAHIGREIAELTEFVCITACALHDAHNALKWSMHDQFKDKQLVRDIYIAFESLRRSADLISSNIFLWVRERLRPHQDRGTQWE